MKLWSKYKIAPGKYGQIQVYHRSFIFWKLVDYYYTIEEARKRVLEFSALPEYH